MQIKEATSGFLLPCTLHYISQELAKNLPLWLSQAFSIFQAGEGHLGLQPGLLSGNGAPEGLLGSGHQPRSSGTAAQDMAVPGPAGAGRADPQGLLPIPE